MAAAACVAGANLRAGALSGLYYRDYSKCLPDYLARLARNAYEKRNAQLDQLTTAEAIRDRQHWVRAKFWELVGGQFERTPLNARTTGQFERSGYRVEKVVYESRPRLFVSANLYLPATGKAPHPGVLFHMGHAIKGKAYASYQMCCQGLARLGYVVLAFDPMGQGERIAYPDQSGTNTRLGSATDEHDVPGKQMLLLGDSASRYQVWDAIRSLDYLASHESVDPARLASAGQSGGATLTMLLACVDDRLSAAAVSSGNTEDLACANFIAPGSTDDAEQDLIGSGLIGFDRWDLLYPIAPKPLLIEVSAHDFFGTYSPNYLNDGREQYQRLAHVYDTLGCSEKLAWRSTPLTHGLTYSLRLEIYNWFERWLMKSNRLIEAEPDVSPEEDRQLWVGRTGNVTPDFGSLRPFDLIRERASSIRHEKPTNEWKRAMPWAFPPVTTQLRELSTVPLHEAQVSAVEINSEAEIWLPGWLFTPEKARPIKSSIIVLDDAGRNAGAHEDGLYHKLAREGFLILAVDVRGIGDARPEVGRGNPGYQIPHEAEEEFAWASLILGNPLLAQRIRDILAATYALHNSPTARGWSISLAARGPLTVPALFAFEANRDIASLYLAEGLASFKSLLETEDYQQPLANFAWDLFQLTDLPELAAASQPRAIRLAGAVDGGNHRLAVPELQRLYPTKNIRFSSEPIWDEKGLGSV